MELFLFNKRSVKSFIGIIIGIGKYQQNSHYDLGYLKSINNNAKETKMKILSNSRQFHKALASWVFLPLFISSITGLLDRVSKDLLGYSREQVHWLMSLHDGEWLGDNGELIYVILNSLGVLWMLITGFQMFSKTISFTKKVTKGESKG